MCFNIVMNKLWRVQNRLENERRKWVYQQAILLSIWFYFIIIFFSLVHYLVLNSRPHPPSIIMGGGSTNWPFLVMRAYDILCAWFCNCAWERERERERGLLITFSPSTVFLTYAVTKVQMYIYANLFSVMSAT